jgi:hypothetical protein
MLTANFVLNVSQFHPLKSSGECVAYCVAQLSKMTYGVNNITPSEIENLADTIYEHVTGQKTQPIPIDVPQLRAVLDELGIGHTDIPQSAIDLWIAKGYPICVLGPESSFKYPDGTSPYGWDTTGIDHCILIADSTSTDYRVCDSANPQNGYPAYRKSSASFFSCLAITPPWVHIIQAAHDTWESTQSYLGPLNYTTGIATAWKNKYISGMNMPAPTSPEFVSCDWQGNAVTVQLFGGLRAEWSHKDGTIHWFNTSSGV